MKWKVMLTPIFLFLFLGSFGSNPLIPKNYYQFGLGFWFFEPFHSQVYTMSYERTINHRFAIGGVFTYQFEEYTRGSDAFIEIPLHDFYFNEAFSHPHLLSDDHKAPGLVYYTGTVWKEEEIFAGLYVNYTFLKKKHSALDIALGGGAMMYSVQYLYEERLDGIRIDSDTVFGWSRNPAYQKELGLAGFFRARYSYQFYNNLYLGSSLVLPYVYASGFPLKVTFNLGVKF
jgi:hypothetical protein